LLSDGLRLGVIPTLAPYVLPRLLPELQHRYPDLRLDLLETQTKTLLSELAQGALDVVLLALPVEKAEFETIDLFNDRFLLAVPANDPLPERAKVTARDVRARRLVLLEEGHCLREQALSYCGEPGHAHARLGATSLATVLQMVASGYGVTLLLEVAIDVELRDKRVKLLRFVEPQPQRNIGLAWRPTSPRKADFLQLGQILLEILKSERQHKCLNSKSRTVSLDRPSRAPDPSARVIQKAGDSVKHRETMAANLRSKDNLFAPQEKRRQSQRSS
jgi:LysR family hydrogen peroxide-inducible transcriptional activator